jgi:hypothetical protein
LDLEVNTMSWMDQVSGLLQQYGGATGSQVLSNVDADFDQVAQVAPAPALSQGLAAAFRSNDTPPFAQMIGQLFGQSNPQQRASLLNQLISAAGPAVAGALLERFAGPSLGNLLRGGQPVTPEVAAQLPPQAVEQVAEHAQQNDDSIVERISDFYAEHPALVKSLGAAALALLLSRMHSGPRR